MRLEQQHNLSGMARILLNGDFTFCLSRDFNELDVAKKSTRQLLRDQLHNEPWTTALAATSAFAASRDGRGTDQPGRDAGSDAVPEGDLGGGVGGRCPASQGDGCQTRAIEKRAAERAAK
jgi:hypothetical protein